MTYEGNSSSVKSKCAQLSSDSAKCSIPFENIKGQSSFGRGNLTPQNLSKHASFALTASYSHNRATIASKLIASASFTLQMEKSEELLSCEEQESKLSRKITSFKDRSAVIWTIFGVLLALTIGHGICCGITCCGIPGPPACPTASYPLACPIFSWGIIVTSCISAALFPALGQVEQQVDQLKLQKQKVCAAKTTRDLEDAVDPLGTIGYTIGGVVAGAVCAAAIGGAIQGGGTAANPLNIKGGFLSGAPAAPPPSDPAALAAPTGFRSSLLIDY